MNLSFSEKIVACLQKKAEDHNREHSDTITVNQLIRVYKRGETVIDSIWRPSITLAQLAMARVNLFLKTACQRRVNTSYEPQDHDILTASDRSYDQAEGEPFWQFEQLDFVCARSDLLLSHITDAEANKVFIPPSVEEK